MHTLVASWRLSLEPIFFLPSDEMAGRHLLHTTPKVQSIGVYTINQLAGFSSLDKLNVSQLPPHNNKDVESMLEAIDKMFQFNQNRRIDMFKDGMSVPGLVLKYIFQELPDYFTEPNEKNKDLYDLYKNNILGRILP
jgi:hypothetical protein